MNTKSFAQAVETELRRFEPDVTLELELFAHRLITRVLDGTYEEKLREDHPERYVVSEDQPGPKVRRAYHKQTKEEKLIKNREYMRTYNAKKRAELSGGVDEKHEAKKKADRERAKEKYDARKAGDSPSGGEIGSPFTCTVCEKPGIVEGVNQKVHTGQCMAERSTMYTYISRYKLLKDRPGFVINEGMAKAVAFGKRAGLLPA